MTDTPAPTYDYEFSTFEKIGDRYLSYIRHKDTLKVYDGLKWTSYPAPATQAELMKLLHEKYT